MGTPVEVARAVRHLSIAYALAWLCIAMVVGPGSAAYVALSGDLAHAGHFVALYFLGAAGGGVLGGRAMDRWGRRPILAGAYGIAALGFAGAGAGVALGRLDLFAAATVTLAVGLGAVFLTRMAVAEVFPPPLRGRGVARLQLSALAGAITGPLLLAVSEPAAAWLGRNPQTLIWAVAPPLLVVAAVLVATAPETRTLAARLDTLYAAPAAPAVGGAAPERFHWGAVATGAVALVMAQAAMIMTMGVAGAALDHQGHGSGATGIVLAVHFLGMFALSTVVGRTADRYGRRDTILTGFLVMSLGGLTIAALPGVVPFGLGLFLIGLGWSFAFIGATVLVADATPRLHSARTMGLIDMATALTAIAVALGGGWWYAQRGAAGLGAVAVGLVVLPALLAFLFKERRAGPGPAPAAAP